MSCPSTEPSCGSLVPYVDSPTHLRITVDARRGGRCTLAPLEPFEVRRRYVPETNVLETTFVTDGGVARVTDALTLPVGDGLVPFRELARRVEGISGVVRLRWSVEPRFGYGGEVGMIDQRSGIPVATGGDQAVAVCSWDAGSPQLSAGLIEASFETAEGSSALIALSMAHQEPLVFPPRSDVERRLGGTIVSWRQWADAREASGPWRDQILRSALALKLLVQAKSGSVAAAPTTCSPKISWRAQLTTVPLAARPPADGRDARARGRDEAEACLVVDARLGHAPRMQVLYRWTAGRMHPNGRSRSTDMRVRAPCGWGTGPRSRRSWTSTAT